MPSDYDPPITTSSPWTDAGSIVHPTTTSRDVALGGSTSAAPFFFDVSAGTVRVNDATGAIESGQNASDVLTLDVYDTGGTAYTSMLTLTAGNPPTADLNSSVTHNSQTIANATNAVTFATGTKTFETTILHLRDSDDSHDYIIATGNIAADTTASLPALSGNDTFVFADETQTLTNKTIDGNNNTLTIITSNIDDNAVTFAKTQDISTDRLLGRTTASSGAIEELDISAITEESSPASGDWILGMIAEGNIRKYDAGNIMSGGSAPVDATYLVNSANGTLTNEVVVSSLTAALTIKGDDSAGRTLTLGQQVTNADSVTVDVPIANFTADGAEVANISATQTLTNKTLGSSTTHSVTPTISSGAKFTFVVTASAAGMNVGSAASDPSTPDDGDLWYNSTDNEYKGRFNSTVDTFVLEAATQTLTNKTIDGDDNTVQDLDMSSIGKTGTAVPIANGGSGQTTQQAAINALTDSASATQDYILTRDSSGDAVWLANAGASGAPNDAEYLVTSANGSLTAEVVVGSLTANLTFKGDDSAGRTITLGQQVTNADSITVDVPIANFTADGSAVVNTGAAQSITGAKTFDPSTLLVAGSTSGSTTINATATASGTLTLPAATDTLVARDTTDTLTNKTLTSPVINTGVSGTAVLDDDTFATASSTTLATSESIKAYGDNTFTAQTTTITIAGDSNEITVAEGAQDLSTNRTFNVGIADNPVLPGTESVTVPSGTTAQRPTAAVGQLRYNSTTTRLEFVDGPADAFANVSNVFDIRRYGAAIDGSTDDTTAWNDAITAANAAGGGWVVHPGGNSKVTGTITLLDGVYIQGLGDKSPNETAEITHVPASSKALFEGLNDPGSAYNDYPGMANLVLTGDASSTTYLVDILKPGNTVFDNMRMQDCATAVIRVRSGIYTLIRNCRLDAVVDGGAYGIHYDTQVDFNGTTLYIENSQIREGSYGIYVEADALGDLHCLNCNFESIVYSCAYLSEGSDAARAHYFFQDIRGEGINRHSTTESPAFAVGMGTGSNSTYFYADRIWISGHSTRNTRTLFQLERTQASIGNVYCNRFYDGLFSTTSQSTVTVHGAIHLRSDEHVLYDPTAIDDLSYINWQASWGNGRSTTESVVQQFVSTASGATATTTINLPAGVVPTRIHVKNKDAITGATTYDVEFDGGLTDTILSAVAVSHNTEQGILILGEQAAASTLNILLRANGSNFTGGEVVVTVWYLDIADRNTPLDLHDIDLSSQVSNTLDISNGGTGQTTQQAAIDALTDVSSASTNQVLTKDGSGNATFQDAATSVWTDGTTIAYLTDTSYDLAAGGTNSSATFYVDVSGADMKLQGQSSPTLQLINPSGTTTGYSELNLIANSSNTNLGGLFRSYAASYSTSGAQQASSLAIISNASNSNGLSIVARATAGDIRFYTGGLADTDLCVEIDSDGRLEVGQSDQSASAWGTTGIAFNALAATYTDSSTAASGTATNAHFVTLQQPTLAATNASVTTTNAATLYLANAPTAGTNQTITNAYAIWVDDGTVKIDGTLEFGTSGQDISSDAGGINYDVPTGDVHDFQVNGISQLEISATQVNFQSNTIVSANFSAGAIDDIGELDATIRTGSGSKVVTGTAGGNTELAHWNADGDLVGDSALTWDGTTLTVDTGGGAPVEVTDGNITTTTGNLIIQPSGSLRLTAASGVRLGTAGTTVDFVSDTNPTKFIVPIKTNTGDPSGTNGQIYYNSADGKFRCYENGAWRDM